jgi:hypothetical protein
MRSQTLIPIAVAVAAFAIVTSVMLLRQPRDEEPAHPRGPSSDSAPASRNPTFGHPGAPVTASSALPQGMSGFQIKAPAVAGVGGTVTAPDIPVSVTVQAAQDNAGPLALVFNRSDKELEITVTAVNAKTEARSVVQVDLLPHQRKNLLDAGLEIGPGDEVTLQTADYPDNTVKVP